MANITKTCTLENDILKSGVCQYSLKQIVDLYFANYAEVASAELGTGGNTVANITMGKKVSAPEQTAKWYHVEPNKDSASFEDTLQVGDAGAKYRQSTVTFSYGGVYDGDAVDNLDAFSLGRFMVAAKLSDGTWVLFGRLTPMEANAATFSSAAEATGFNGQQITLTNNTTESPLPLEENAWKVITGAAS